MINNNKDVHIQLLHKKKKEIGNAQIVEILIIIFDLYAIFVIFRKLKLIK